MDNAGVGKQLREAREAQNLSLEQISQATYIRVHYLQALEAGDFESFPSITQATGFMRTLASYLKLDPESLLSELNVEGSTTDQDTTPITGVGALGSETPVADAPGIPPGTSATTPISTRAAQTPKADQYVEDEQRELLIFKGIGEQLQKRRELLGLTLEDVERHTRLRIHYLVALEAGDIRSLPSPVQGRGMLNNYAVFLGMDPEPVLLRYAEGLQAGLAIRQARQATGTGPRKQMASGQKPASRVSSRSPLRRFLSGDLLFGSLLVIALLAFAVWGTLRILNIRAQDSNLPTPPSIAIVLLATETPLPSATPTPLPQDDSSPGVAQVAVGTEQTPIPTQEGVQPISGGGVQLYITIYQRALLRVVADGEEIFFARVIPGSAYTFEGSEQVEFLTSNGAAVQVFFNGEDQGILGLQGQVIFRIYTPQGIITPTPTITPTPEPTEIPTATVTPTQTVSPDLPPAPTLPALP